MVVDLAAHHQRFAADGVGEVGRVRGRGIGDDGQRRLQRMGEIAGVAPRFLGLRLAMGEQLVDLLGQRPDLGREIVADPRLLARADGGDLVAHPAQRPQAVEGLQRGEHEQADAEREEAPEQRRAQALDLVVDRLARLRDLEAPADRRARQDRVALGDAQRLGMVGRRKFVAVVEVRLRRRHALSTRAGAGPTASATGRSRRPRR